jgi:16S rRNA (cytidine1402-2'-O)-methyltransferase
MPDNASRNEGAALVLVPNALDHGSELSQKCDLRDVLPLGVIERVARLDAFVVEDAKSARAFLGRVHAIKALKVALQAIDMQVLPRPPTASRAQWQALLAPISQGRSVGLLSDAGLPGVADPGAALVALAHEQGLPVEVLSGPSSITLAIAASGLQGQAFSFAGYLPSNEPERSQRIRQLESRSRAQRETQIAIETPYRNEALMAALVQSLQPNTRLAVACGLTQPGGFCHTQRVAQWRSAMPVFPAKLPAVFSWLCGD